MKKQVLRCNWKISKDNQTGLKTSLIVLFVLVFIIASCKNGSTNDSSPPIHIKEVATVNLIDSSAIKIIERFLPPVGFEREIADSASFQHYLRNYPLLDIDEKVYLYNGQEKVNQTVHASVLDVDVGDKNLQQCADAVMRLRSDYLYHKEDFDKIGFHFTNGWYFGYKKWRAGNDLIVNNNTTSWTRSQSSKNSKLEYNKYLEKLFMYAGTLSLSKELTKKEMANLNIGDVFIHGGSPGHAIIIVDLANNKKTGEKTFLLAQSYMPAQQIHILKNPNNIEISPWYLSSDVQVKLVTPEWTFELTDLMSFD